MLRRSKYVGVNNFFSLSMECDFLCCGNRWWCKGNLADVGIWHITVVQRALLLHRIITRCNRNCCILDWLFAVISIAVDLLRLMMIINLWWCLGCNQRGSCRSFSFILCLRIVCIAYSSMIVIHMVQRWRRRCGDWSFQSHRLWCYDLRLRRWLWKLLYIMMVIICGLIGWRTIKCLRLLIVERNFINLLWICEECVWWSLVGISKSGNRCGVEHWINRLMVIVGIMVERNLLSINLRPVWDRCVCESSLGLWVGSLWLMWCRICQWLILLMRLVRLILLVVRRWSSVRCILLSRRRQELIVVGWRSLSIDLEEEDFIIKGCSIRKTINRVKSNWR